MIREVKERLKAIAAKKRGVLLKDVDATDFNVAIDAAIDAGLPVDAPPDRKRPGAYLKYATPEQQATLAARVTHETGYVFARSSEGIGRDVKVYSRDVLAFVLTFLTGKNARKYMNDLGGVTGWWGTYHDSRSP